MVSKSRQYRKRAHVRDRRSTLQDSAGTGAGASLVRGSGKHDKRDRRRPIGTIKVPNTGKTNINMALKM